MSLPVLYIGNRRFSSWSLRAWLVLKRAGIEFETRLIPLHAGETRSAISAISPGGTVPALHTDDGIIWDSLAISEWAAERNPELWPRQDMLRSRARSAAAMMHAGFFSLREHCPMDLTRDGEYKDLDDATLMDIAVMQALWHDVGSSSGPYLFGEWTIADAFFTPAASRFRSYAVSLHSEAQSYCDTLLAEQDFLDWHSQAQLEDYPNPYDNPL